MILFARIPDAHGRNEGQRGAEGERDAIVALDARMALSMDPSMDSREGRTSVFTADLRGHFCPANNFASGPIAPGPCP